MCEKADCHAKRTIVFLHGVATTSIAWKYVIRYLDPEKFRLISPDLLGFGASPRPSCCKYTVEEHIAFLHETLEQLRVEPPFILVGHSMGSIIATNYCRNYPEDVEYLLLLSLPLYIKSSKANRHIQNIKTDIFLGNHKFLSEHKRIAMVQTKLIHKILRIDMEVNEENWDSFRLSVKNTIIKQNTYDDLMNTKQPIRIIYGNLDEFLVQKNLDDLSFIQNITITRLNMIDHVISPRFAKSVAKILNEYPKPLHLSVPIR